MFDFMKFRRTNFKAGGLPAPRMVKTFKNTANVNPKFIAPKRIDNRDICIPTSDQGPYPECAAYSTAGFIEVKNWKRLHYPEQIDPHPIYRQAKKNDGNVEDGTSLDSAAGAAIELNLIQGDILFVDGYDMNAIKFAIHTHDVFIGGFRITEDWNYVHSSSGIIANRNNSPIGGHAVLVCGYDQTGVYIQNSWGIQWGLYGFALIPWEQALDQFMYGVVISQKAA